MESDADRRFRRLAAAISHDADPGDDLPGVELDVTRRTFTYDVCREGRPVQRRTVAVLDAALEVGPLDGEIASEAWGEDLSNEDGWFRFALNGWYEDVATRGPSATGWWTLTGPDGALPVPPWEVADYQPPPPPPPPDPDIARWLEWKA